MDKMYSLLNLNNFNCLLQASKKRTIVVMTMILCMISQNEMYAQETYTLGTGTDSFNTAGPNPIATIWRNNRSQYVYFAYELYDAGFNISGNVVSIGINVTELALPEGMQPENIKIKMGMTTSFEMGPNLIDDLPVYYETSIENINTLGWHTITLDTPFAWDGFRNIIIEICRNNENFGTSFSVEGTNFGVGEAVTVANFTNEQTPAGCTLSNENVLSPLHMRRRPNMQFTMTNPCDGTPSSGQTIVSAGPYCSGDAFTLSVQNGSIESGLSYQWQSAPNENGPWSDIPGAVDSFLTTTQSIATYYRRATTCDVAASTIYDFPLFVGGEGCYCTSLVVNENAIGITNVSLESINNSSASTPAYTNFTSIQTNLERDSTVSLSANVSTDGGANYTMAWIDWNQNGAFDANEAYNLGTVTGGTNVNSGTVASIEVPADAVLGTTIMRVRTKQSGANDFPSPCDSIENGEAEDYTVNVIENLSVGDFSTINSNLIVATNNLGVHLKTTHETIQEINIYDLGGRLVYSKNALNDSEVSITDFNVSQQLWIIKVTFASGQQIAKKISY